MSDEKDAYIDYALVIFPQPTDRQCMFCHDKFKGLRVFCDKEQCRKDGVAFIASRRGSYLRDNYGLIDYQPSYYSRKGLVFDELPSSEDDKDD